MSTAISQVSAQRLARPVLQRIDTDAAARLTPAIEPRTARTSTLRSCRSFEVSAFESYNSPGISGEHFPRSSSHDIRLARYTRRRHLPASPYLPYASRNDTPIMTASTDSASPNLYTPSPRTPFSSCRSSVATSDYLYEDDEAVDPEDAWNLVPYHVPWGSSYVGYKSGTLPGPDGGSCIFLRSPTPLKNQRTGQACEKCRERKAKCSGNRPSCTRCAARGHVCEYSPETKRARVTLRHCVSKPNMSTVEHASRHRRNNSTPITGHITPPSPPDSIEDFDRRDSMSSVFSSVNSVPTSRSGSPDSPVPHPGFIRRHTTIDGPVQAIMSRKRAIGDMHKRSSLGDFALPRSTLGLYFPDQKVYDAHDELLEDAPIDPDSQSLFYPLSHPLSFPPYSFVEASDGHSLQEYRFPPKENSSVQGDLHDSEGPAEMDVDFDFKFPHQPAPRGPRTPVHLPIHAPSAHRYADIMAHAQQPFVTSEMASAGGFMSSTGSGDEYASTGSSIDGADFDFAFTPSPAMVDMPMDAQRMYSQPSSQAGLYAFDSLSATPGDHLNPELFYNVAQMSSDAQTQYSISKFHPELTRYTEHANCESHSSIVSHGQHHGQSDATVTPHPRLSGFGGGAHDGGHEYPTGPCVVISS